MYANEWYYYRVQDKNGKGPYFNRDIKKWVEGNHNGESGRPDPFWEEGITIDSIVAPNTRVDQIGFKCGFLFLSQLQAWFRPGELRKLEKLGFRIVRVKGTKLGDTPTQSLFREVKSV